MSREDGFGIADVDVALLDDAKVRQLVRSTRDEGVAARCLIGYTAVLLASWRQGQRVTLDDAAPLWLTDLDDLAARLRAARLLDDERRIPEKPWTGWFGPAWERREERREAGRKGGYAKARGRSSATAEPEQSHGEPLADLYPSVPSVPSYPSVPSVKARANRRNRTTIVPTEGPCRICGGHVRDSETGVRVGPGWIEHPEHPDDWTAVS